MLSEDDIVAYAPDPDSVRQTVRSAMRDVMQESAPTDTARIPINDSIRPAIQSAGEENGAAGILGVSDVLKRLASTAEAQLAVDQEMRTALNRQAQDMSEINERIANQILQRDLDGDGRIEESSDDESSGDGSSRPVRSSREIQEEMLDIQRQQLDLARGEKTHRERSEREKRRSGGSSSETGTASNRSGETQLHRIQQSSREEQQILRNLGLGSVADNFGAFHDMYSKIGTAFNTLNSLRISATHADEVPSRLVLRAAALGIDPRDLVTEESDNAREMTDEHEEAVREYRQAPSRSSYDNPALDRGEVRSRQSSAGSLGAPAGNTIDRSDEAQRVEEAIQTQENQYIAQTHPDPVTGSQSNSGVQESRRAQQEPPASQQPSQNTDSSSRDSSIGSELANTAFDAAVNKGLDKLAGTRVGQAATSALGKVGSKVAGSSIGRAATGLAAKAGISGAGKLAAGAAGGPIGWALTAADLGMGLWRSGRELWWDQMDKGSLQGGDQWTGMQYSMEDIGQDVQHFLGMSRTSGEDQARFRQTTSSMNFRIGSTEGNNLMDVQKWANENGIDPNTAAQLTQTMIRFGAGADEAQNALKGLKESANEAGIDLKKYASNVASVQGMLNSGGADVQTSTQTSEQVLRTITDTFGGEAMFGSEGTISAQQLSAMLSSPIARLVAQQMGAPISQIGNPSTLISWLSKSGKINDFADRVMRWNTQMANDLGGGDYEEGLGYFNTLMGQSGLSGAANLSQLYDQSTERYSGEGAYSSETNQSNAAQGSSQPQGALPGQNVSSSTGSSGGPLPGQNNGTSPLQAMITITTDEGMNANISQNNLQRGAYYGQNTQTMVLNSGESQR